MCAGEVVGLPTVLGEWEYADLGFAGGDGGVGGAGYAGGGGEDVACRGGTWDVDCAGGDEG